MIVSRMASLLILAFLPAVINGAANDILWSQTGQVYPTCYQNITSTMQDGVGFIQLFALAIVDTQILVEADNKTYHNFGTASVIGLSNSFNYTPNFNTSLSQPDPVNIDSSSINNYGIIVSSESPMHLYSIKSDMGTTDGYICLPLSNNSVEFMIAGWPAYTHPAGKDFLATLMVVPALNGTCVELYKIHNGTNYELVASDILSTFQTFRYFAKHERYLDKDGKYKTDSSRGEDITGYKLNSSKPVQVIFGHECAWIPTIDQLFCDYIAETMIPVNELGLRHVMPMILGRDPAFGYIVRVVPSQDNTVITFKDGDISQSKTVRLGSFEEFNGLRADRSAVVICSKPCAVYQYNKGYKTTHLTDSVPTDPYMTMVIPNDRFTADAPFSTPSFCRDKFEKIEFDNYVSIITYAAYKDSILFDGQLISTFLDEPSSTPWTEINVDGEIMVSGGFHVTHGDHFFRMSPDSPGSFAAYAYGHSLDQGSSSGYGFSCNFNSTGIFLNDTFREGKKTYPPDDDRNQTCLNENNLTGTVITSNIGSYASFPFTLTAEIYPPMQLSLQCMDQYKQQLLQNLQDFSKKINYWICASKNCSYLSGEGVGINYATLKVNFIQSGNEYVAVEVYVEMIAKLNVKVESFATCRAEIMNYMFSFINWPPNYTDKLLNSVDESACQWPINFSDVRFTSKAPVCPRV